MTQSPSLLFNLRNLRTSRAFTFIELSVSMAIVIVLVAIAVPVYTRITENGRAASCMSNLRQIGGAVQSYLNDHEQTMPALAAGRSKLSEDKPVIDNTLNTYLQNPRVFACPADYKRLAATTGTSYFWNLAVSGQRLSNLNFLRQREWTVIPLLSDKEAFHPYTETKVNILYADGHATKDLRFMTSLPSPSP